MRIQRDIPSQLIQAGVKKSNLRQIVLDQLHTQGKRCRCIRCREVGLRHTQEKLAPCITVDNYEASEGDELFISIQDLTSDVLIGYLRLRIPSEKGHRSEIMTGKTALVREIHIYGPQVPVGKHLLTAWQHKGYGTQLIQTAENVVNNEYDLNRLNIISALGTRNYFRSLGYHRNGPYMTKSLKE
jgi:elongator complex protein 3